MELTPELLNQKASIRKKLKQSPHYKNLTTRKYKSVTNYTSWERIVTDLVSFMEVVKLRIDGLDQTSKLIALQGYYAEENFPSVYWIAEELISSLLKIDIPEDLSKEDLIPLSPCQFFLLPKGYISSVDWIAVRFVKASEKLDTVVIDGKTLYIKPLKKDGIVWITVDENMVGYSSTMKIPFSKEDISTFNSYDADSTSFTSGTIYEQDKLLTLTVNKLVTNLLVLMRHKPQFILEDKIEVKSQGFSSSKKKENLLNPIFIGKDFLIRKVKVREKSNNTVSRSRNPEIYPYWVRGHWRRVVVGKREENRRELKLISPYIVIGNKNNETI